jgi:hypothetical protein
MGTSRTNERRLRKRALRQASRFESVAPEKRRRPTGRERRRMAHLARADRARRRTVWWEWGPVTAATLVAVELLYFFVVADTRGGTSIAGIAVAAAIGFLVVCFKFVQEYVMWPATDAKNAPFLVVGVVSAGVMFIAMVAETLS